MIGPFNTDTGYRLPGYRNRPEDFVCDEGRNGRTKVFTPDPAPSDLMREFVSETVKFLQEENQQLKEENQQLKNENKLIIEELNSLVARFDRFEYIF